VIPRAGRFLIFLRYQSRKPDTPPPSVPTSRVALSPFRFPQIRRASEDPYGAIAVRAAAGTRSPSISDTRARSFAPPARPERNRDPPDIGF